ncbi:hypothetical protein FB451DRAFT_1186064 [Mycena latifolia]|nr:hypothetical protein FB451DRAFT_1186064 [Mycena latifolia]
MYTVLTIVPHEAGPCVVDTFYVCLFVLADYCAEQPDEGMARANQVGSMQSDSKPLVLPSSGALRASRATPVCTPLRQFVEVEVCGNQPCPRSSRTGFDARPPFGFDCARVGYRQVQLYIPFRSGTGDDLGGIVRGVQRVAKTGASGHLFGNNYGTEPCKVAANDSQKPASLCGGIAKGWVWFEYHARVQGHYKCYKCKASAPACTAHHARIRIRLKIEGILRLRCSGEEDPNQHALEELGQPLPGRACWQLAAFRCNTTRAAKIRLSLGCMRLYAGRSSPSVGGGAVDTKRQEERENKGRHGPRLRRPKNHLRSAQHALKSSARRQRDLEESITKSFRSGPGCQTRLGVMKEREKENAPPRAPRGDRGLEESITKSFRSGPGWLTRVGLMKEREKENAPPRARTGRPCDRGTQLNVLSQPSYTKMKEVTSRRTWRPYRTVSFATRLEAAREDRGGETKATRHRGVVQRGRAVVLHNDGRRDDGAYLKTVAKPFPSVPGFLTRVGVVKERGKSNEAKMLKLDFKLKYNSSFMLHLQLVQTIYAFKFSCLGEPIQRFMSWFELDKPKFNHYCTSSLVLSLQGKVSPQSSLEVTYLGL